MHSTLVRVQNVFGFFTTVAFFVGALVAVSVVLFPAHPAATVAVRNVKVHKGRQHYTSTKASEYAVVNFDLTADLAPLFNWNTKQVFAYLTLAYGGAKGSRYDENEVVVWDRIVTAKDHALVELRNERAKYNVADIAGKFLDRNATARFYWNVQPHVGVLTWGSAELGAVAGAEAAADVERTARAAAAEGSSQFVFPPLKTKKKPATEGAGTA